MGLYGRYLALGVVFFVVLSSSLAMASTKSVANNPVPLGGKVITPLSTYNVVWKASTSIYIKGFFRKTVYFSAKAVSQTNDGRSFNIDHIGLESTVEAYYDLDWHVVHRGRHDSWDGWRVTDVWNAGAQYERYLATTHYWFEDARFQNWYPTLTVSTSR